MFNKALLAPALQWVGRPHEKDGCYKLVRGVYRLAGIELPEDHSEAHPLFARVWENDGTFAFVPQAFDVLRIANAYIGREPFVNHVAVAIGEGHLFLHSMEDAGHVIGEMTRVPWRHRIRSIERYTG